MSKGRFMELENQALDYTLIAAIVLACAHWFGPRFRRMMRQRGDVIHSFGGGLAVAYVFLSLFPEIELAHEWLGDSVHAVTLASFLLFFALEARLLTHRTSAKQESDVPSVSGGDHTATALAIDEPSTKVFWWHIALMWFYTWMVVFAFPDQTGEDPAYAFVGSLAVGLHLIYKDYVLRGHHHESFASKGRHLLAIAPLAGWLAHRIISPSEVVFDIFIAVLAGILIQGVFRDELPRGDRANVWWMIAGATTFAALIFATSW